jgi:hypothetical protein
MCDFHTLISEFLHATNFPEAKLQQRERKGAARKGGERGGGHQCSGSGVIPRSKKEAWSGQCGVANLSAGTDLPAQHSSGQGGEAGRTCLRDKKSILDARMLALKT